MVTYYAVRKKHAVEISQKPTVALSGDLNQPIEQSNAVYEDVTDLQYPENIGLSGNIAYNLHSIDGGDDIQSENNDTLSYYCN